MGGGHGGGGIGCRRRFAGIAGWKRRRLLAVLLAVSDFPPLVPPCAFLLCFPTFFWGASAWELRGVWPACVVGLWGERRRPIFDVAWRSCLSLVVARLLRAALRAAIRFGAAPAETLYLFMCFCLRRKRVGLVLLAPVVLPLLFWKKEG